MRVVVAGGGSAGHIEPALAFADALRRRVPEVTVTALGTERGLDTRLIPARGYDLELIPPVPIPRRPGLELLRVPLRLRASVRAAADVLRLLADPTRLRLLAALTTADRDVTELTELTGVPRPAVSQHLGRLRLAGLVESRPDGRRRIYAVRNGHVRRLVTETLAHADHLLSGLPDHE